jgi:hypothetical protein
VHNCYLKRKARGDTQVGQAVRRSSSFLGAKPGGKVQKKSKKYKKYKKSLFARNNQKGAFERNYLKT